MYSMMRLHRGGPTSPCAVDMVSDSNIGSPSLLQLLHPVSRLQPPVCWSNSLIVMFDKAGVSGPAGSDGRPSTENGLAASDSLFCCTSWSTAAEVICLERLAMRNRLSGCAMSELPVSLSP